jgi:hypothetical protein
MPPVVPDSLEDARVRPMRALAASLGVPGYHKLRKRRMHATLRNLDRAARTLARSFRLRPCNHVDPVTLEPLARDAFVLVEPNGKGVFGFDACALAEAFAVAHEARNPYTYRELFPVEVRRLARASGRPDLPVQVSSAARQAAAAAAAQAEDARVAAEAQGEELIIGLELEQVVELLIYHSPNLPRELVFCLHSRLGELRRYAPRAHASFTALWMERIRARAELRRGPERMELLALATLLDPRDTMLQTIVDMAAPPNLFGDEEEDGEGSEGGDEDPDGEEAFDVLWDDVAFFPPPS